MLAARAAKSWLARTAADVKLVRSYQTVEAPVCMNLVFCLPALESVMLSLGGPLTQDDLECLLKALAGCPHLKALNLSVGAFAYAEDEDLHWPWSCAAAFAVLSSLTKLALRFYAADVEPHTLADMVGALAPLTALAELSLGLPGAAVVPGALGQFKGLRLLELRHLGPCVFEAGCLDLPKLETMFFGACNLGNAQVLPCATALQSLTRIELMDIRGSCFFDPGFSKLPQLQRMVVQKHWVFAEEPDDFRGLIRLPADMGLLSSSLLHLNLSALQLAQFPRALTQLVALEWLNVSWNPLAELPAGVTALSRLTELRLGRAISRTDPLQLHVSRSLDVRALGDLLGFPALRELTFSHCEVMLCPSLLGAMRHASLASLCFCSAHPAPECASKVLQLVQELRCLGRGSMVRFVNANLFYVESALQAAQGRAPCQKFAAALEACGL